MGIPATELALHRGPIAIMITSSNHIEAYPMKLIRGPFFKVKRHGIFMADPSKAMIWGDKNPCYFYDVRSMTPMDMKIIKELESYTKQNNIHEITQKDLKHSGLFSIFKNKESLERSQNEELDQIRKEIEQINQELKQQNDERLKSNQPPLEIDTGVYGIHVLQNLTSKSLISTNEATALKSMLLKGELSFTDFIYELEKLKHVDIQRPLSHPAQLYLKNFGKVDPTKIDAFIDRAEMLGKKMNTLGSKEIKNLVPIAWIAGIMIIVIVVALIVGNADFANITDNLKLF